MGYIVYSGYSGLGLVVFVRVRIVAFGRIRWIIRIIRVIHFATLFRIEWSDCISHSFPVVGVVTIPADRLTGSRLTG